MQTPAACLIVFWLVVPTACATTAVVGDGPGEITYEALAAQTMGKSVRVQLPTERKSGTLLVLTVDSVVLEGASRVALPMADVTEISLRPDPLPKIIIGGFVGGGVGAAIVTCDPPACKGEVIGLSALGGAIVGGIVGSKEPKRFIISKREQAARP